MFREDAETCLPLVEWVTARDEPQVKRSMGSLRESFKELEEVGAVAIFDLTGALLSGQVEEVVGTALKDGGSVDVVSLTV
jgi:hypothetical protein